jgi:hypothetical protein
VFPAAAPSAAVPRLEKALAFLEKEGMPAEKLPAHRRIITIAAPNGIAEKKKGQV